MDSLAIKRPIEEELVELKAQNKRLSDCLKTTEVIVTQVSKANQRLTEAVELSVHKIPEFKPLIGFIKDLEESVEREKDILRQLKASLVDTNCGQNVTQLVHKCRDCVEMNDKCVQTDEECEEAVVGMTAISSPNEPIVYYIDVNNGGDDCVEPMVAEENHVSSDHSMTVAAHDSSSAIDIDHNHVIESEVSVKTTIDTDGERSGGQTKGKRQTRVKREAKSVAPSKPRPKSGRSKSSRVKPNDCQSPVGPFPCDWPHCHYTTEVSHNLVYHTNAHKGIQPFVCVRPDCEYRTSWPLALVAHRRRHIIDNN